MKAKETVRPTKSATDDTLYCHIFPLHLSLFSVHFNHKPYLMNVYSKHRNIINLIQYHTVTVLLFLQNASFFIQLFTDVS